MVNSTSSSKHHAGAPAEQQTQPQMRQCLDRNDFVIDRGLSRYLVLLENHTSREGMVVGSQADLYCAALQAAMSCLPACRPAALLVLLLQHRMTHMCIAIDHVKPAALLLLDLHES
jgi:hypothetical protein